MDEDITGPLGRAFIEITHSHNTFDPTDIILGTMATIANPAVPQGSTVLVTGVNGFLGSHIANQFLRYGYKVRGTVRDPSKESWAIDVFSKLYGKDKFELFGVPEMEVEGAYDEAVKGEYTPPS